MTEQEQQIALCEWAGWKRHCVGATWGWQNIETNTVSARLPDTNSLDVLHSFEQKLRENQFQFVDYFGQLFKVVTGLDWNGKNLGYFGFNLITATPEQRRKALLITLNLWREDSNEGRE